MKKKILFFLINMNLGGTEKSFLNLISALPPDVEVDLLLLENEGQLLTQLPKRVNLRIIEESESVNLLIQNSLLAYALFCFKKFDFIQTFRSIYFYIKSKFSSSSDYKFETIQKKLALNPKRYDVAIAYAGPHQFISTYIAKNTHAKKKIQWIHFDISKISFNINAARNVFEYFDEIKVVSKEARQQFVHFFPKFNDKTEVYHNIINRREVLSLSKHTGCVFEDHFSGIRIITVGRLTKEKGYVLAIEAISKLVQKGLSIKYYIIGTGNQETKLKKLVNSLNMNEHVVFLGLKLNPFPYMLQADIYLQPSFYEGHCVTILESKLLNKPIVSTNFTGAAEELKQGETGIIVNIDVPSISLGLQKLIENPALREKFEQNLINENLAYTHQFVEF